MRREHFTLDSPDDDAVLVVTFAGPAGLVTDAVTAGGRHLDGDEVDAVFRLQDPADASDARGVFSLTRRLTGEYLLEVNASADDIFAVVGAARAEEGAYRLRIVRPEDDPLVFEKDTLLVYDTEGNLRRQDSLIPGGVEL